VVSFLFVDELVSTFGNYMISFLLTIANSCCGDLITVCY